jgi:hypothetical protein
VRVIFNLPFRRSSRRLQCYRSGLPPATAAQAHEKRGAETVPNSTVGVCSSTAKEMRTTSTAAPFNPVDRVLAGG